MTWLVSCLLIRMQISYIEKHLRAPWFFLLFPLLTSLFISSPLLPHPVFGHLVLSSLCIRPLLLFFQTCFLSSSCLCRSLFVSQSCQLFPSFFLQWLCSPEVDLTRGCMFGLVWTRFLFMLQERDGWVEAAAPSLPKSWSCWRFFQQSHPRNILCHYRISWTTSGLFCVSSSGQGASSTLVRLWMWNDSNIYGNFAFIFTVTTVQGHSRLYYH